MSWFTQVRNLLLQYQLPHPLLLLDYPLNKEAYKKLVKAKVVNYWEVKLRAEASFLRESEFMPYFYPDFHSIIKPFRLLTSGGNKM